MMIEIKSDGAVAQINTHGAELSSLKDVFGTEYIWQNSADIWPKHAPVLFPFVGRSRDGKYTYGEYEYEMGVHGFAPYSDFEVVSQEENRVDFMIKSTPETLKIYPFDFHFKVSFSLSGTSLNIAYSVSNTGDKDMLFCIGAHPGFNVPLVQGDSFEDYELKFEKEEDLYARGADENSFFTDETVHILDHKKSLPMTHELFNHDAIVPVELKSKSAVLSSRKTGRGVSIKYDGFKILAVWSKKGNSQFICLEPWIGMGTDATGSTDLKDKRDVITLAAQKTFNVDFTVGML